MKFNSRFFAVILTLCMVMNLAVPASAAMLDATYEEASYYDIATTAYSRMLMFENGVVPAANTDKLYGLVDVTGKVIVPFQYNGIWSLGGGYFSVSSSDGRGIIDSAGKVIVPCKYGSAGIVDGGRFFKVSVGSKYGIVDSAGKLIIPCQYGVINPIDGLFVVWEEWSSSAKRGIIDSTGKFVLAMGDQDIFDVNGYIGVRRGVNFAPGYTTEYFDTSMQPVSEDVVLSAADDYGPLSAYDYYWESGSYYSVRNYGDDGGWGLLDKNYNVVFPVGQYSDIGVVETVEGTAFIVETEGGPALLSEKKETLIPTGTYDNIVQNRYSDGFLAVTKGEQRGAVSITGKTLVPLGGYNRISGMNKDGYIAAVSYDSSPEDGSLSNIVSKIFKDGVEVKTFDGKHIATEVYYRDLAFSTTGERNGMMDIDGNVILEEKYTSIDGAYENGAYTGDLITCIDDEEGWGFVYGMYTADGEQIFADKYTEMYHLNDGKYRLNDGEHYGVMSKNGTIIIPFSYVDMRVHTLYFIELYDGQYYSIVDVNNNTIIPESTEEINLFFKSEEHNSLDSALGGEAWRAGLYDGYSENVYPFCYKTTDGYATAWVDYTTGKSEGEVPYRASNVNEDGQFVYRAANGLYGFARLSGHIVDFNSEGGGAVAAQYVDHGSKLSKPTDPTKDGHDFGGWYTDTVFDGAYSISVDTEDIFSDVYKWNFDTDVVEGDFTLHAKWTASQNDNDDNQNNDQNNNTNTDNGGGGNGGYDGPVNIPGKKPEQPKPEQPKDEEKPVQTVTFSDVPTDAYYADAVAWAVEKGITNGVGGDSFAPEASCTRGQMVTFLWRMAGCPTVSGGASFSDVTTDSYYADAIAWAVSMGITNGTGDGLFSPDAECSRAQMAVFLFRMVGASAAGGSSFGDVDAGAYYADAVAWAVANGITNGTGDGLFSPSMTCTRAQMVTFLFRCFGAQQ